MPTTATLSIKGKVKLTKSLPLDVWLRKVELNVKASVPIDQYLEEIKGNVLSSLKSYIDAHRSNRPKIKSKTGDRQYRLTAEDNLYNVIATSCELSEEEPGVYRLGLGKLSFLNYFAPYWKVLNNGGYVPPPTMGVWGVGNKPIPGRTGQQFFFKGKSNRGKQFGMFPEKPITPIRYISHMQRVFEKEVQKLKHGGEYSGVSKTGKAKYG